MLRKALVTLAIFAFIATGYLVATQFDAFTVFSDTEIPDVVEETVQATAEVVPEVTIVPTIEPTKEPVVTKAPEPTAEPTEEPAAEPTADAVEQTEAPGGTTQKPSSTNNPTVTAAPSEQPQATTKPAATAEPTIDTVPDATDSDGNDEPTAEPENDSGDDDPDVTQPTISTGSASNGYVLAAMSSDSDCAFVIFIDNEMKESGSLSNDGKWNKITLLHGDATYKIIIGEFIGGAIYPKAEASVTYTEIDPYAAYLQSTGAVPFSDGDPYVVLAKSLTAGMTSNDAKAYAIYSWVVQNIRYDEALLGTSSPPSTTYSRRTGICVDFATLYAAMCRSVGVPTAVTTGFADYVDGYHAWNQFRNDNDKWSTVDASSDAQYMASGQPYSFKKDPALFDRTSRY